MTNSANALATHSKASIALVSTQDTSRLLKADISKKLENISLTLEMNADFRVSARTAIGRTKVSAPLQVIINGGYLGNAGSILHFGKGRENLDSGALQNLGLSVVDYDFVYCPQPDVLGKNYDFILCSYVVNTLPKAARAHVYRQLVHCCSHGTVFISGRSDNIKGTPEADGVRTGIGTFQRQYRKGELKAEALEFFKCVEEIKSKSGMSIVMCTNPIFPIV